MEFLNGEPITLADSPHGLLPVIRNCRRREWRHARNHRNLRQLLRQRSKRRPAGGRVSRHCLRHQRRRHHIDQVHRHGKNDIHGEAGENTIKGKMARSKSSPGPPVNWGAATDSETRTTFVYLDNSSNASSITQKKDLPPGMHHTSCEADWREWCVIQLYISYFLTPASVTATRSASAHCKYGRLVGNTEGCSPTGQEPMLLLVTASPRQGLTRDWYTLS